MKLDEYLLADPFEVFAYWWLPEHPEEKVPGTLTFSPNEGASLELQGIFQVPAMSDLRLLLGGEAFQTDCIYGEQIDGRLISIHQAFLTQMTDTATLHCRFVLSGAHLDPSQKFENASILVSYENLDEWSGMGLLTSLPGPDPNTYSYAFPASPVNLLSIAKTHSSPELTLFGAVVGVLRRRKATFEKTAQFKIEIELDGLEPLFGLTSSIGQLLTILIGAPTNVIKLRLILGSGTPIDVFFERSGRAKTRELHSFDMPFSLQELGDDAGPLFSAWFDSHSLLRPTYTAFFSTIFNDAAYIDTKFQTIMQAIESFHRNTQDGFYLRENQYAPVFIALANAIPNSVDPSLRERLKTALKYGNEFSLRKRFKELLSTLDKRTLETLRIDAQFVDLVVDTRNYYAHLDTVGKTSLAYNGKALFHANERLSALLLILILKRLGLPEGRAVQGIIKGRMFS